MHIEIHVLTHDGDNVRHEFKYFAPRKSSIDCHAIKDGLSKFLHIINTEENQQKSIIYFPISMHSYKEDYMMERTLG